MTLPHSAAELRTKPTGRVCACLLPVVMMAALSGCRHKPVAATLPTPVAQAPIALETPPATTPPAMIPATPAPATPPTSSVPIKPTRAPRKKPAAPPVAAVPAPVAVAATPAEPGATAIGALSSGGDATSHSLQEARDLIAGIGKRLSALPAAVADTQKESIRKVRQFLRQAQQAATSGDAEGAKTLATKAKVLMDDIEK